jgi:hypothetical protein
MLPVVARRARWMPDAGWGVFWGRGCFAGIPPTEIEEAIFASLQFFIAFLPRELRNLQREEEANTQGYQ